MNEYLQDAEDELAMGFYIFIARELKISLIDLVENYQEIMEQIKGDSL